MTADVHVRFFVLSAVFMNISAIFEFYQRIQLIYQRFFIQAKNRHSSTNERNADFNLIMFYKIFVQAMLYQQRIESSLAYIHLDQGLHNPTHNLLYGRKHG